MKHLASIVGRAAGLILLVALAACATPQTDAILSGPAQLPLRAEITEVPFFPQEKFYCGPAALAMTLAWSGLPVTQAEIATQVYTPGREGTLASDIVAAARRNGRLAVPVDGLSNLLTELAAGHPVVVFQNLGLSWYTQWHFAVAVGYDLTEGTMILRSGLDERRLTSLATFERTWERADGWALAVLPPDTLPVTASEETVLYAAAGLEQAGKFADAEIAYGAIFRRWPQSFAALMGLGNTRYAMGDAVASERAFRMAVALDPEAPAAWNNLAYALVGQGRRPEAVAAALRAVALGGSGTDPYRSTLIEVSGAPN